MTLNNVTIGNGDVYVQIDGDNIAKAVRKQNSDYKKKNGKISFFIEYCYIMPIMV